MLPVSMLMKRAWIITAAPHVHRNLLKFSSVELNKENSLEFHNNYSQNQVSQILEVINTQSELELTLFNISKSRLKKISTRKQKQGTFSTLEDVLELDGFGVKVLERFCDSILSSLQKVAPEKQATVGIRKVDEDTLILLSKKKQSYVTPIIPDSFRQSVTSCVSFHLDLNNIAWTRISLGESTGSGEGRSIAVNDWMCHEIGRDDKKLSLSELIQIVLQLTNEIPEADSYVVEAIHQPQIAKQPGNPVHMNINVQRSQLFSMLSVLMAARDFKSDVLDPEEDKQLKHQMRVFFLRSYLSSRLFKIYVGREKVSTDNVVSDILNGNLENQPRHFTTNQINVPDDLKTYYEGCNKVEREYMGQSLLVGLTFMKLCILKCSKSITTLNKRT